jgi:Mrp family chromosome partitioning ATPase/capsular polysaccharide biosynthesis protein
MEPIEYLRIFRRRWLLIASCVVIGVLAAVLTAPSSTTPRPVSTGTTYTATATLRTAPDLKLGLDRASDLNLGLVKVYVTTGEVPKRVAKRIGWPRNPALLAAQVTVVVASDVGTIRISTTAQDSKFAEDVANGFSEETQAFLRDEAERDVQASITITERQLKQLTEEIAKLSERISDRGGQDLLLLAQRDAQLDRYRQAYQRLQDLSVAGAPDSPVITLEPATAIAQSSSGIRPPSSPVSRVAFAGVLALLLGLGSALVLERFDTRLRTRKEIEEAFDLPVVAEIPKLSRAVLRQYPVISTDQPESPAAEGYRRLRSALLLATPGTPPPDGMVVLVVSPTAGDGKTSTTANLATCLSEAGRTVLIVDCDFRGSGVHLHADEKKWPGLSDLPGTPTTEDLGALAHPTRVRGASVVTSGIRRGSTGRLAADLAHVVTRARSLADVVILDSSPLLASSDATDLLPLADWVVVVARSARVRTEHAHRVATLVRRFHANPLGICLVGYTEDSFRAGPSSGGSHWQQLLGRLPQRSASRGLRGRRAHTAADLDDEAVATTRRP